ncbi:hypothetical protein ACFT0G_31110 [Streptomyces sp. NPDC057020]|uniref:hypothetical protein n=1 Tax=unclassified Streptomyces TaxID=2593676 RepID=UPI00362B1B2B
MLKTKVCATLAAIALTLLAVPAATASTETADAQTGMGAAVVEYNGSVTTLAALEDEVGETHCHDAKGQGQLTCFASEREADLDLLAMGGLPGDAAKAAASKWGVAVPKQTRVAPAAKQARTAAVAAAGVCHPWVTTRMYDGNSGSGSSVTFYCDYTNLGAVGWDNRANSVTCIVCKTIYGANPYRVSNLREFQNTMYQTQVASQEFNQMVNITANTASSLRLGLM